MKQRMKKFEDWELFDLLYIVDYLFHCWVRIIIIILLMSMMKKTSQEKEYEEGKTTPKSIKTSKKDLHLKKLSTIMANLSF